MSSLRKRNAIIFLLGAGASYKADIPISAEMIKRLESLMADTSNADLSKFYNLYHYIKCAINYGYGIQQCKQDSKVDSVYNIESLVMTLDELAKKDEHLLYPFIGAWNPKLMELTGQDFQSIKDFKDIIIQNVRDWVKLDRKEKADYYQGLIRFHEDYEHPLRIFSLNYDLCVENAYEAIYRAYPERGFYARRYNEEKLARTWSWQLLDESIVENESKTVLLYKLHGSIDWKRHSDGKLTFEDNLHSFDSKETAIIFGTAYKLQYYDPFLYLYQEFRKWSLQAKLIVCIGYGFYDEHINSILGQALNSDQEMKLLWVAPVSVGSNEEEEVGKIKKSLKLNACNNAKVIRWNITAEAFMMERLKIDELSTLFPQDEEIMPEIILQSEDETTD